MFDEQERILPVNSKSFVERSVDHGNNCMYRGENGLKCAIGFHIADEDYDKRMENKTMESLVWENYCPQNIKDLFEEFPDLCVELQLLHDDYSDDLVGQAKVIARDFSIDPAYIPDALKEEINVQV